MKGKAVAYGAVTIVNAMASGRGSAMGIKLRTWAEVEVREREGIEVEVGGVEARDEDRRLAEECFKLFSERFKYHGYGCKVTTRSEIPIARGLKSSSVASNAIMLALASAFGLEVRGMELVRLGVEASKRAGVTLTGAFDDACASYFGGIAFTDNYKMSLLKMLKADEKLKVAIIVPEGKAYTKDVKKEWVKGFGKVADVVFDLAVGGRVFEAMTLNGLLYSALFGYGVEVSVLALRAGALGSGLSGKGPSVVAVGYEDQIESVVGDWRDSGLDGDLIVSEVNNEEAMILD